MANRWSVQTREENRHRSRAGELLPGPLGDDNHHQSSTWSFSSSVRRLETPRIRRTTHSLYRSRFTCSEQETSDGGVAGIDHLVIPSSLGDTVFTVCFGLLEARRWHLFRVEVLCPPWSTVRIHRGGTRQTSAADDTSFKMAQCVFSCKVLPPCSSDFERWKGRCGPQRNSLVCPLSRSSWKRVSLGFHVPTPDGSLKVAVFGRSADVSENKYSPVKTFQFMAPESLEEEQEEEWTFRVQEPHRSWC